MIRLYTLGTTRLLDRNGHPMQRVLGQPKSLALLSYLAVSHPGAFHSRDHLLALFWPEQDEKHARWALNQVIHRLRAEVGSSIVSRGSGAIGLSPGLLWCDAVALDEAFAREAWRDVVQIYRGEFLGGLHVAGCAELAQWLDAERLRLRKRASKAIWAEVDWLVTQGALQDAVALARDGVRLAPEEEPDVRRLIALLDQLGDRAGAVQAYLEYRDWLSENLEVEPAPETVAAIEAVKARSSINPAVPSAGQPPVPKAPNSVVEPPESATADRIGGRSWQRMVAMSVAAGLLLTVGSTQIRSHVGSPEASIRSIAVLPLDNLMRDLEEDYFVEGMHEALITELSKVGALKVISRTSTLRYRETEKPLPQVAEELDVDGVIEGSVLREGGRVRITLQLIHGPTDRHLWSRTFERELRGILALQSDIARAVADEVKVTLTPVEQRVLDPVRSVDPEAHQAYLRGRYLLGKGSTAANLRAREQFQLALERDPGYAPAYVGLADVYNRFAIHGRSPPREVYPLAQAAVARALELDENQADAHALRGVIRFRFVWDWEGAEQDLKRALELEPNSGRAHLAYGMYLLAMGRLEEALAYSAKLQQLDPLSPLARGNLAVHFYHNGRYAEAEASLRSVVNLDPTSGVAYAALGQNRATRGAHREAVTACARARALAPEDDEVLSTCGAVDAASGEREAALAQFETLRLRSSAADYLDPYRLATLAAAIYTGPTDTDRVLYWLTRAYEDRSANLCFVKTNPAFERLRSDPRFQQLLQRIGLSE